MIILFLQQLVFNMLGVKCDSFVFLVESNQKMQWILAFHSYSTGFIMGYWSGTLLKCVQTIWHQP